MLLVLVTSCQVPKIWEECVAASVKFTLLHYACSVGALEVVRDLVALGADTSVASTEGTPMQVAQRHGRLRIVRFLQTGASGLFDVVVVVVVLLLLNGYMLWFLVVCFASEAASGGDHDVLLARSAAGPWVLCASNVDCVFAHVCLLYFRASKIELGWCHVNWWIWSEACLRIVACGAA